MHTNVVESQHPIAAHCESETNLQLLHSKFFYRTLEVNIFDDTTNLEMPVIGLVRFKIISDLITTIKKHKVRPCQSNVSSSPLPSGAVFKST